MLPRNNDRDDPFADGESDSLDPEPVLDDEQADTTSDEVAALGEGDVPSEVDASDSDAASDDEIVLPDKPAMIPEGALVALDEIELLDNPRGDVGDIGELAESIRVGGLIHPVVVRRSEGKTPYQLVVGYRRYDAHRLLERKQIPVVVVDADDENVLQDVITENLQRRGWSPLAEAKAMQRMIDVLGYSRARVAASLGVHRSQVTKRLALLELPDKVRSMVDEQTITASHAEVLMSLKTQEAQEEMAELAAKSGAPVNKLASWTQKVRAQEEEIEAAQSAEQAVSGATTPEDGATAAVPGEITHEALIDDQTPMETPPTLVVTLLPRLIISKWGEVERKRALLYLLLRASNDREVLDYLAHEHSVELSELWNFVDGSPDAELDDMIETMLRRWYRAPHRYPTLPAALRATLGDGEELVPPREPAPEWESTTGYDFDEWEDEWED